MKAVDAIEIALAIEMLAYHDKNYLSREMCDNCKRSEAIQALLKEALNELKNPHKR